MVPILRTTDNPLHFHGETPFAVVQLSCGLCERRLVSAKSSGRFLGLEMESDWASDTGTVVVVIVVFTLLFGFKYLMAALGLSSWRSLKDAEKDAYYGAPRRQTPKPQARDDLSRDAQNTPGKNDKV